MSGANCESAVCLRIAPGEGGGDSLHAYNGEVAGAVVVYAHDAEVMVRIGVGLLV